MRASAFHSDLAGRLVDIGQDACAFVPAPLPPELVYDADLHLTLSQADAKLGELAGLARYFPYPHLFVRSYSSREAVYSSRIEGTHTTFSDLLASEIGYHPPHAHDDDLREVCNYVAALEYGMQRLKHGPLSFALLCEMHAKLFADMRGETLSPGTMRERQNYIGVTPADATYVPPPVEYLGALLENWDQFLHERGRLPDLVQCGLLHAQFESIHPFLDGNGRIGRLFVTMFLLERERMPLPLLYLSAYINAHRAGYYGALQRVRTHGAWGAWLRFFLVGVVETAQQAIAQANKLTHLHEEYQQRLRGKSQAQALLNHCFAHPFLSVATAAHALGVSAPAARQTVALLAQQGILEEVTGKAWGRRYRATGVLQIVAPEEMVPDEEDTPAAADRRVRALLGLD